MNNLSLVRFCRTKLGTDYVYGCKGEVLTNEKYQQLKKMYGDYIWDTDIQKVGKVCVDCSGLISWATGKIMSANTYKAVAKEVHPIADIDKAPIGAAVWRQGHIGVYVGDGRCIEARGSKYGVVETRLKDRNFTHWFPITGISYKEYRPFKPLADKFAAMKAMKGEFKK